MNHIGCGRKWSWPNLNYEPGICLGTEENQRKTSVRMISVLAGHFPNTSQKRCYCWSQLACWFSDELGLCDIFLNSSSVICL
jgi:hypothetical protein